MARDPFKAFFSLLDTMSSLWSAGVSEESIRRKLLPSMGPIGASRFLHWLRRNRASRRYEPSPPPPPRTTPSGMGGGGRGVRVASGQSDWPQDESFIDTRRVSGHLLRGKDALREHETPQSSNVYSFAFDREQGILYVTFKAGGRPVGYRDTTNMCTGEDYSMGVRAHVRGPTYAYGGSRRPVPPALYEELLTVSSKGRFVWRNLRKCGSRWQHQFPYRLVTASYANGEVYVPRKATRRGFRVRSVEYIPTIGELGPPGQPTPRAGQGVILSTREYGHVEELRPEGVTWAELDRMAREQGMTLARLRERMAQRSADRRLTMNEVLALMAGRGYQ